eukprot:TRINITY_DN39048_c0_g1_i1.p1 TRINITY_DN39048_c0_g1~~TRINITY_DN39048_c0_g1_i1.p1  ORF type:complete len:159 (+),score=18.26 TRINITY_DN39048_c0_g1_i1:48-479(+)
MNKKVTNIHKDLSAVKDILLTTPNSDYEPYRQQKAEELRAFNEVTARYEAIIRNRRQQHVLPPQPPAPKRVVRKLDPLTTQRITSLQRRDDLLRSIDALRNQYKSQVCNYQLAPISGSHVYKKDPHSQTISNIYGTQKRRPLY